MNPDGNVVDLVEYSNTEPWPVNANGTGNTIELLDVTLDNYEAENWSGVNLHGTPGAKFEILTGTKKNNDEVPKEYSLKQNYPNPFNPSTIIEYSVPKLSNVNLKIFDILGRTIVTLVNSKQKPGFYQVEFDASNLSSGIYFYRIQAIDLSTNYEHPSTGSGQGFVEIKKMMLLK